MKSRLFPRCVVKGSTMIVTVEATGAPRRQRRGYHQYNCEGCRGRCAVGNHVVALPGQPPSQPVPGTRPETITTPVYVDPTADLFDKNGAPTTSENYLDIVKVRYRWPRNLHGSYWIEWTLPGEDQRTTTFIEWTFCWIPIITQIPVQNGRSSEWYRLWLHGSCNVREQHLWSRSTESRLEHWSDINYTAAVFNYAKVGNMIELYIPAEAIGNPDNFVG